MASKAIGIIPAIFRKGNWIGQSVSRSFRYAVLRLYPNISIHPQAKISPEAKLHAVWEASNSITIEAHARISEGVLLYPEGGHIEIGEAVYIGPYTVLYGHGGLRIGKNSLIANHVSITPFNHRFSDPKVPIVEQGGTEIGVTIGEDVWIGAGAQILDGVTIGRGCVVGAGAVVTKSLPEFSIAVGVPARVIGQRGAVANPAKG